MPSEFPSAEEPPEPAARSQMRASDADRDRVMDILRAATAEGRLTVDELEERGWPSRCADQAPCTMASSSSAWRRGAKNIHNLGR